MSTPIKTGLLHAAPSLTLGTLKQYAALTLGRVKRRGLSYRVERCPWCKADGFALKLYVFDGVGRCKCGECGNSGDIFALAGAYLDKSPKRDKRQIEAHILDRLERVKQ